MPMYDYQCKKCKHIAEFLIVSPYDYLICEKCGATAMKRLYTIGSHATIWKGGHWNADHHDNTISNWAQNHKKEENK